MCFDLFANGRRASRTIRVFNFLASNGPDIVDEVSFLFCARENRLVDLFALGIQLTGEDAFTSNALECMVESADAREQVDELKLGHCR